VFVPSRRFDVGARSAGRASRIVASVTLDPIISLAVALAEAPGSCAVLLGAGVSVDAGVPTGWSVYRDGLRRLYRLEEQTDESHDDEAIDAWLVSTGRENIGYSGLLDLIAPDQAIRREILAGYFEGIEPGPSHDRLAALAAAGYVRVFLTTNFDRLLERALLARGIEPVVVSDDATLAAAPRREHADIFIVKCHGDYLQETIRNTPSELAALEPELSAEIESIVSHYGVLVLGWSGADPALAAALRGRRSRYGVWWLSLADPPAEPGRTVAEAIGARVIVRNGAAEMLAELDRRLGVYAAHESGDDPGSVHDETLGLVRRGADVSLDELLRRERYEFESGIEAVIADHINHHDGEDVVRDAGTRLTAAADRRLASLIPLALHHPEIVDSELHSHASWASAREPQGGGLTWQQAWTLPFWMVGMALGALLVRLDRYAAIRPLLTTTWTTRYDHVESFVCEPGEIADPIAHYLGPSPPPGRRWTWPAWGWLSDDLPRRQWLVDRYPEWLRGEGEPGRSLIAFSLLRDIAEGLRGNGHRWAWWSINSEAAMRYARQLHRDPRLREAAASAVGLSVESFEEQAPEILQTGRGVGDFPNVVETANVLRTGSFR
jgi:hypothetical protein